jgi:hypothetical protein
MKVSRQFMQDFEYVAVVYGWTKAEIDEIKAVTRLHAKEAMRYWSVLAAAHRAGYVQDASTGWVRLRAWCAVKGVGDPLNSDEDFAKLQALAFTQLETA